MKNYYSILGVPENCSQDEIKKAYRKLARKFHPDASRQDSSAKFRDIQEAYENIGDAEKRKSYDEQLNKFKNSHESFQDISQNFHPSPIFRKYRTATFTEFFDEFSFDSFLSGVLEIELDPHEARSGGVIPIQIPIQIECPQCHGFGHNFFFFAICSYCSGSGFIKKNISFSLKIPPNTKNGDQFAIKLPHIGKINIAFSVQENF